MNRVTKNFFQKSNFKFFWIFFMLNFKKPEYFFYNKFYKNFKDILLLNLNNSNNFYHFSFFFKKKKAEFKGFKYSFPELSRIKHIIGSSYSSNINKLLHVFNLIFICGLPSFFFKKTTLNYLLFNKNKFIPNRSFFFYNIGVFYTIKNRHDAYLFIVRRNFITQYSDKVYRFFFFFNTYFYRNFKDNFLIKKFNKLSLVWWSVKKNFFSAITTIDNLDDYYMQLDFLGFWSTGIFLALFKLPKSVKHRIFFKVLIVKHVRRTMVILNFFRFLFNLKNHVFNFKVLWNVLNSPLQEIFVNPDTKQVIADLKLSNSGSFDSQISVFKDKIISFCDTSLSVKEKEDWWFFFKKNYEKMLKFNKIGSSRNLSRYVFKCDMIIVLRKETFTILKNKKAKSLKKRMTKRIVKEAKRRHWVF